MPDRYTITAECYLARARARLDEHRPESLFYAAFELRCGVEARLREYLEFQDHVAKKKKKGWKVAALGKTANRTFRLGDKVARFTFLDPQDRSVLAVYYYTPVTSKLQRKAEKLGNYLHAARAFHPADDPWWQDLRALLESTYSSLKRSTRGTLLGAPLVSPAGRLVMNTVGDRPRWLEKGARIIINVEYLLEYPDELDAT